MHRLHRQMQFLRQKVEELQRTPRSPNGGGRVCVCGDVCVFDHGGYLRHSKPMTLTQPKRSVGGGNGSQTKPDAPRVVL